MTPKPLFVAADTAWRMLTQRDAYVNMLRATMATFSAGLGGADSINVLPHTLALGLPDAFARRAARNTQLVLLEESNLAKVSDPAAGSGGIETLTQQLCEAAWSLFQEIEKAGGVFAALEQGLIQRKVAATRKAREANIARRKEVLTGATEFPNLHEAQVAVLDAKPVALAPYGEAKIKFDPLPPMRLAAPFEALRDRSDQILKKSGARPKDFPRQSRHARRLHRARHLRQELLRDRRHRGGRYRRIYAIRLRSPPPSRRPAPRWPACAPPTRSMPRRPPAAAKALQAAGARHIYLAGRPGEQEAAFRAARRQRFHLRRRRRAGGAAGSLAANGASMTSDRKPVLTGGCQCGAVRFAVYAGPVKIGLCHCRMCQKAVGGPFISLADVKHEDFAWTRGKPAAFRSSSIAERDFCAACGTPLSYRAIGGDMIEITTGSFDRPDLWFRPMPREPRLIWPGSAGFAICPAEARLKLPAPKSLAASSATSIRTMIDRWRPPRSPVL